MATPATLPRARWLLSLTVAATVALYAAPGGRRIAYPLVLVSTLAHELGHGVTALLVGGRFESFQLWSDASGAAVWSGRVGRLGRAAIAAGGLLGPALVAALLFACGRRPRWTRAVLLGTGFLLALVLVLFVRNLFGAVFVALLGGALLLLGWKGQDWVGQAAVLFLGVQLALSVYSRSDYLFVKEARTASGVMPSDVAHIAEALWLPYWLWGAVVALASALVLAWGVWPFLAPGAGSDRASPG